MVQEIKIVWTNEAKKSLKSIADFIAKDSIFYAEKVTQSIYDEVQVLLKHPEIGSILPITSKYTLRRLLVKSYRIIYVYHNNTIYILLTENPKRLLKSDYEYLEKYL